ncbi:DNA-deoxyinosine glycosylase [Aminivibrio sp.]
MEKPSCAAREKAVRSFPPVSAPDARLLILGSMPGRASLAAVQYYAHPRNAFWSIMEEILALPPAMAYEERLSALKDRRIALWDVLASCVRPGSLDSDIEVPSIIPNDFVSFFANHPLIQTVFFNGTMAEQSWKRHVLPTLPPELRPKTCIRLPSTSPAHAGRTLREKIEAWRIVEYTLWEVEK